MKFVVFREINQRWYWELRSSDGGAVASSPLGFSTQVHAFASIQKVRATASNALVFDLIDNLCEGV